MSKRKKKRRKRKKSKSKDSGLETEENMGMDELEGYGEAHEGYDQMTEINRFYVSSQPSGVLDDGRCRECLMDCGKTRSHSLNKPMDFRFHLREDKLFAEIKKYFSVLFSKMISRLKELKIQRLSTTPRNPSE